MHVLVGGVATLIGHGVATHLRDDPAIDAVVGLDARPLPALLPGVRFVRARIAQPEWRPLLRGVDAAVWLVGDLQPARRGDRAQAADTVADLRAFLDAVRVSDVGRLVVVNDAALYGAQGENPVTEMAAALGHSGGPYARTRARAADYLDAWGRTWPGTLIRLRPALVVGPHYRTAPDWMATSHPLIPGREARPLQVLAENDLIAAVAAAIRWDEPGVYNVAAAPGTIRQLAGDSRGYRPWIVQWIRAWWGWRWRGSHLTPEWLARIFGGVVLDVTRWQAAGGGANRSSAAVMDAAHDNL